MKTFKVNNRMGKKKTWEFSSDSVEMLENNAEKLLKTFLTTLGVVVNSWWIKLKCFPAGVDGDTSWAVHGTSKHRFFLVMPFYCPVRNFIANTVTFVILVAMTIAFLQRKVELYKRKPALKIFKATKSAPAKLI